MASATQRKFPVTIRRMNGIPDRTKGRRERRIEVNAGGTFRASENMLPDLFPIAIEKIEFLGERARVAAGYSLIEFKTERRGPLKQI